jgi:hypothetical protein
MMNQMPQRRNPAAVWGWEEEARRSHVGSVGSIFDFGLRILD